MHRDSKSGVWVLTDLDMLLFSLYAQEAITNYGQQGYTHAQAEAVTKDRFIRQTLKEANTLPVNFDR